MHIYNCSDRYIDSSSDECILGDSTGPSVEFPSTKKKVKIFKWKKWNGSPLYLVSWLIWHSFVLKQRNLRCAKNCSPGFFMCHFFKHLLHCCYVEQRHFRCTRIGSFCFVTVFMPLQMFCNCFLAVTNFL